MTERGASQSRGARVVRGLGAAVSAVVIAALSHVAGGGAAPGLLGSALALAFAVLVCIALAGRRFSPARTTVAVTLSQFVFHVLFSLGAAIPTAHGHDVSMLGMVMTGGNAATLPALGTAHVDAGIEAAGAIMWAGHAMAAVATILLLLHGERGLFSVIRIATERLRVIVGFVCAVARSASVSPHRVARALAEPGGLRPLDVLVSCQSHRGPPRVA
jgi:TRAP-type mannitol/chloroaromatic compound transport system permease small subunit